MLALIVLAFLLALQLLPNDLVGFNIERLFSFEQFLFIYIIIGGVVVSGISTREMQKDAGGGIAGFSIGVLIGYAIVFIGIGILAYIIGFDYEFNNSDINSFMSLYLFTVTILFFIESREAIFLKV